MRRLSTPLLCVSNVLCLSLMLLAGCQEKTPAITPQKTPVTEVKATPAHTPAAPVTVVAHGINADRAHVAKLSNGMTVIAKRVPTAPVVSVRGYVRAGKLYEGRWLGCGLSHLLEHLVAKDALSETPDSEGSDAGSRTAEIGGQFNAYTTDSHACYYISAAANKVDLCIDMIVDQLAKPSFTRVDFEREHGVVQRELVMGKDNPMRILHGAHNANVYRTHPAAVPTIGFAAPLSKVTYEDIQAYHAKMYVPQGMVFVVVGDIDPAKAIARIVEKSAGFREGRSPEYVLPAVSPFSGIRRRVIPSDAYKETAEMLSFQTIPLIHDDLYALDVLSYILTNGQSSRLVREIQYQQKKVTKISSWSHTPAWGKGTFTVSFRTKPGQADIAEKAILAQLASICKTGVQADELARAKRQKIAGYVHSQQTMESIASTLATDCLATGDLAFSRSYTDNIQTVTAKQVQAAARKYLDAKTMTITRVVPASFEAKTKKTDDDPTKAAAAGPRTFTLPNGLRVVLMPSDSVKLVSMVLASKGGLLRETPATNGLGTLMARLSTRGAGKGERAKSADDIAKFFNEAGGSISGMCGDSTFVYSASVLSDRFDKALPIFADVIQSPSFSAKELDTLKPLAIASVRRVGESWFTQLNRFFRAKFFTDSPWQMLASGQVAVIEKATPQQLRAYHKESLRASDSVLAVYGDFDQAKTRQAIETLFAPLPKGKATLPAVVARTVAKDELHILPSETKQAGIILALPGTTVSNTKDRLPLMLIDTIISGYRLPSGWLHTELRGKQLVYVVHAFQKTGLAPGAFLAYAGTGPDKATEVVSILQKHFRRAADYKFTQAEMDQAITTIVTSVALQNQTLSALAMDAAVNELYGLGVDWTRTLDAKLRAITPAQVRAVAKQYFSSPLVTVVLTPKPEAFSDNSDKKEIGRE